MLAVLVGISNQPEEGTLELKEWSWSLKGEAGDGDWSCNKMSTREMVLRSNFKMS